MTYISKLAVIDYKIDKCTRNYKKTNNERYYLEYLKLTKEKDYLESVVDNLYYEYQNAYNIHKIIEISKQYNLKKIDVIKHFDFLYKKQFKVSKYYIKQYKKAVQDVN